MTSPGAISLDAYCAAYGIDPAMVLGIDDPFIAHDFREAIRLRGVLEANRAARKPTTPGERTVDDLIEQARAEGAKI